MKKIVICMAAAALMAACSKSPVNNGGGGGGEKPVWEKYTEGNIVGTDALGRVLPDNAEAGTPPGGRYVGMFYWTWHYHHSSGAQGKYPKKIVNISEVVAADPSAGTAAGVNSSKWPAIADHNYLWWGEPLFDYYISTDKWVARRHAEMMAMAGVDVVFFDCTNGGFLFPEGWKTIFEVFKQAQDDGVQVPKIAFFMGFNGNGDTPAALTSLYNTLYQDSKWQAYSNLWFMWKGKPLILAYPNTAQTQEIRDYFTFRPGLAEYNMGPDGSHTDPNEGYHQWGWLQLYPQHGFGEKPNGKYEQMPVGVAQNWATSLTAMNHPQAFGRSYTKKNGYSTDAGAVDRGLNYQEQWDRALDEAPEFVFITGWNEWLVGRAANWGGITNAFPDAFDQEHSRDIEPMKGGHGDNYYMQTVSNIRNYKGIAKATEAPKVTGFGIDGQQAKWADLPAFTAYKGNTFARNSKAYDHTITYTNTTGRNDITSAKVAYDDTYLYFYAEVAGTLSSETDDDWMYLLIDADRSRGTGWEGYDYIVNRSKPSAGKAVLDSHSRAGWFWGKEADLDFARGTNWLEVRIPRSLVGQEKAVSLEFKWVDNMQEKGNIMDFYVNGDSAPLGRFNYLFTE